MAFTVFSFLFPVFAMFVLRHIFASYAYVDYNNMVMYTGR